jgi:hypothetical protein
MNIRKIIYNTININKNIINIINQYIDYSINHLLKICPKQRRITIYSIKEDLSLMDIIVKAVKLGFVGFTVNQLFYETLIFPDFVNNKINEQLSIIWNGSEVHIRLKGVSDTKIATSIYDLDVFDIEYEMRDN